MSEIRYLKITLIDGTRFILRTTKESPLLIRGIEVNAEGDEVVPPGAAGYHNRTRLVQRELIKKAVPLRMNNKYATLEVALPDEGGDAPPKKTAAQLDAEIAEALGQRRSR